MGKAASEGGSQDNTLTQFFVRDPSGYYIELCNCNILTDFVFGNNTGVIAQYREGRPISKYAERLLDLAKRAKERCDKGYDIEIPSFSPASSADTVKLSNLVKRRLVYGDLMQSFSEEEILAYLLASGNDVPVAVFMMKRAIERQEHRGCFSPPGYYKLDGGCKAGGEGEFFKPQLKNALLRAALETLKNKFLGYWKTW